MSEQQEVADVLKETVAETLHTVAGWLMSDRERDMLYATAVNVRAMESDDACCALCEEVECDEGCPLAPVRPEYAPAGYDWLAARDAAVRKATLTEAADAIRAAGEASGYGAHATSALIVERLIGGEE